MALTVESDGNGECFLLFLLLKRVFLIRPRKSRPQLPRGSLWNTVEPPQVVEGGPEITIVPG